MGRLSFRCPEAAFDELNFEFLVLDASSFDLQAIPQLIDRSKLPNIIDPVIKNTMNLKHLYQVPKH